MGIAMRVAKGDAHSASKTRDNRADGSTHLLRGDVVGADDVAPELDLALEQRARCFRRLLVGRRDWQRFCSKRCRERVLQKQMRQDARSHRTQLRQQKEPEGSFE